MNDNQEESDAASALLEMKRHVMTGREIEICERMHPLKKWGVPEVELEMEGDDSPAVLRAENLLCVIMPMWIK